MISSTQIELKIRSLVRKYFHRNAASNIAFDPYDVQALQQNSIQIFKSVRQEAVDPTEKCRNILNAMQRGYPTETLTEEYFAALELALRDKPILDEPGQIVIGVGPGRCGSTSLSEMLGTIANSCCTHEGPPLIFWRPLPEQVEFHLRRFELLRHCYSVVSDVAHWWLNAIGDVLGRFPDARIVGLVRDPEECATSFMRIQGFGKGSSNPWAAPGNNFWQVGVWDATYPSYPVPDLSKHDPDRVKLEQITRYVRDYNEEMARWAQMEPERVKLVRTETISSPAAQAEIFALAKHRGETAAWRLNVRGTRDGKKNQIKL